MKPLYELSQTELQGLSLQRKPLFILTVEYKIKGDISVNTVSIPFNTCCQLWVAREQLTSTKHVKVLNTESLILDERTVFVISGRRNKPLDTQLTALTGEFGYGAFKWDRCLLIRKDYPYRFCVINNVDVVTEIINLSNW